MHVSTVKPVLSDHIKQDTCLAFQTGCYLLLHESNAESSCRSFLHYFHSAISNHLSIAISMSPEWMVAINRLNCTVITCKVYKFPVPTNCTVNILKLKLRGPPME